MAALNKTPYSLPLCSRKRLTSEQRFHFFDSFPLLFTLYIVVNVTAVFACGSGAPSGAHFEVEAKRHETLPTPPQARTPSFPEPLQLIHEETYAPSFMALPARLTIPATRLGGFPVSTMRGSADMTDVCLKHRCAVAHKVTTSGSCGASFKCGGCAKTGTQAQMTSSASMCEALAPPTPSSLILGVAYSLSSQPLEGNKEARKRESTLLAFQWDNPMGSVDISHCMIEDLSIRRQQQVLQQKVPEVSLSSAVLREFLNLSPHQHLPSLPPRWSSTAPLLHVRLVFAFSIINLSDKDNASFTITIRFTPPVEYYADQKYIAGGQCTQMVSTVPVGKTSSNYIAPTQLVTMVHSVSIPFEDSQAIKRENFEVMIKCNQKDACHLSKYRICARIICNKRPKPQILTLNKLEAVVGHLKQHPEVATDVPSIPEDLQAEYELLKMETALKAQEEKLAREEAKLQTQMEARATQEKMLLAKKRAEEATRKLYAAQEEAAAKAPSEFNPSPETVYTQPNQSPGTVEYRPPITIMANDAAGFPRFLHARG